MVILELCSQNLFSYVNTLVKEKENPITYFKNRVCTYWSKECLTPIVSQKVEVDQYKADK